MAGFDSLGEDWSSEFSSSGENLLDLGVQRDADLPFMLDTIRSVLDSEDLSLIRTQFGIPASYELELLGAEW